MRSGGIDVEVYGEKCECVWWKGGGRPIRVPGMYIARNRDGGLCGCGESWVWALRGGGRGMGAGCGRELLGDWR